MSTDAQLTVGFESVRSEIAGLRDDMREDLRGIREEMKEVEDRVVVRFTDYVSVHSNVHATNQLSWQTDHQRYDEYIRNAQLVTARRDGALGVLRYIVELVARHSGDIIKILVALGGLALALSGRVGIVIQ